MNTQKYCVKNKLQTLHGALINGLEIGQLFNSMNVIFRIKW